MKRDHVDYVDDIITECEYLLNRKNNISYEEFIKNEDLRRAFIRSLEIIGGEASKKIPIEIKTKIDLPWKEIAGMRDKLIHDYFGVDYSIIWKTIEDDIPILLNQIKKLKDIIEESK